MSHRFAVAFVFLFAATAFVALAAQGGAGRGQGQAGAAPPAGRGQGQGRGGRGGPITLKAARVLDGRGGVIENGVVTVQGARIVSVAPAKAGETYTYEFPNATIMPGMIDVHVHL